MEVRITFTVDEERLRQIGPADQAPAEIMELLAAMRDDDRLSLQSRNYWLPVRDLTVRPVPLQAGQAQPG